jgi:hypothetical protein
MKNRFLASLAILTLAGALTSLQAQTTEAGPGPSEQPSAPMEVGQGQSTPPAQADPSYNNAPGQNGSDNGQPMPEAQPGGPTGTESAETNQGVGRVSMIHGDVSTQRGDSGDWSAAVLNQPVLNGDKVSTGPGGRAEVQLDFANILRLGSSAQANIATFTHDHIQIQLSQGLANYSVFNESEAEPEIDTPNVGIHPAHKDVMLRIEVRPDGDTIVIVRKGEAQISTPKGIAEVHTGEMATIRGTVDSAQYKISPAPPRDDWDRWNTDRDHMIHSAKSWDHTNKYYTGAEDLDANGHWQNADEYGQVWVPNEPEGWAPYRDGNWTWEPYYGWTWVGYEPWGWAPYHYGRWMWYGNSWAWWPGPVWGGGFYRPFWAPAYVGFFGFGGGFGVGFGFGGWGGFGWLPLGPCDWFHPWWGGFRGRFGVVNINNIHVTNINRFGGIAPLHGGTRFSNLSHINDAHIGHALSTVGAGKFGAGRVSAVAATHAQLSSAKMMTGNLPVVPTHASLSASGRAAAPSTIHSTASQHFASTQSNSRPEAFQQQASHLQQSMQQNHVSSVAAGGRADSGVESRGAAASSSKPSAGTAAGREGNNSPSRGLGSQAGNNNSRSFSPPNANASTHAESAQQGTQGARSETSVSAARGEPNRSEWKPFTPPSHSNESTNRGSYNSASSERSQTGSYWNRTAPSSSYSRGSSGSYERGGGSYSRPQLNMHQPIVQPRSSGSYGGYHSSPGYSSPSYGGSHSTPSYGGSHGGYSGGSHSAPSSGGSHKGFSAGGASHSSHSSSHSSGGYSHGGSHSSGGGHSSSNHSSGSHSKGGGGHSGHH